VPADAIQKKDGNWCLLTLFETRTINVACWRYSKQGR